ncbi:hypothetical protein TRFO_33088 [Tritrichomonas foetus]|uniref:Importin N-terminal domain-containing protein n=1 Tax=Tritrichomonas foetus TaxID=1144522 RepID=A0A1J4JSM7_9EUKA|nr:hypothetical protein TRFO_33088 [Tritrichomonas foetus]|eukprot:OHT00261.1 hypothetical protein TRFO_33088 [Tritrichomonas foetus]
MNNNVEHVRNLLVNFTNPNNTIRSAAEASVNKLIEENPVDFFTSILGIMNIVPNSEISYLCAITINNFLNISLFAKNPPITPDFFLCMRNALVKFANDLRFPQNINSYILSILSNKFYVLSFLPFWPDFSDFVPFLISLLDNMQFRSNSLDILCGLFSMPGSMKDFYPMILQKCDFLCDDMNFRTNSLCFYLFCLSIDSNLQSEINNFPILQILADIPDKEFNLCLNTLFSLYFSSNNQLFSYIYQTIFPLTLARVADGNRLELMRVSFVFSITNMFHSTSFLNYLMIHKTDFIAAMSIAASNPIQFLDLYCECRKCLKELSKIPQTKEIYGLYKEYINFKNIYVSSLFCSLVVSLDYLELAFHFASHPDSNPNSFEIVRRNGLSLIKKLLRLYSNELQDNMAEIGQRILQLYNRFQESYYIKVLVTWSYQVSKDVRDLIRPAIISLCQKQPTIEIISCASSFCDHNSPDSGNLAIYLMESIVQIAHKQPDNFSLFLHHIEEISNATSPENIVAFFDQLMPIILDDPQYITNYYIASIFSKYGNLMGDKPILLFQKIYELILMPYTENNSNFESLFYSFKQISNYSQFIPDFQENYLQNILKSIFYISEKEEDHRLRAASIICITKLLQIYSNNIFLIQKSFELLNTIFKGESELYVISKYLKLYEELIDIRQIPSEYSTQLISNYSNVFLHSYESILVLKEGDKTINEFAMKDISKIISSLLCLFNVLLSNHPKESIQILLPVFLEPKNFDIPEFHQFFVQSCSVLITVHFNLITEYIPPIIQILINFAMSDDLPVKCLAIVGLGNFFGLHKMPINLINDFVNILIPIIAEPIDQKLFDSSFSVLLVLATNYFTDGINTEQILRVMINSFGNISKIPAFSFQSLIKLTQLCLVNELPENVSQALVNNICLIIQKQCVENRCLFALYNTLNTSSIPEAFQPIHQILSLLFRENK